MKPKRSTTATLFKGMVALLAVIFGGWGPALPAQAQDGAITVECAAGSNSSGPLRLAIQQANAFADRDTIVIDPNCLFELDNLVTAYPEGRTNLPAISRDLTIVGNGATLRRPSDGTQYRMLLIDGGVTVTLKDMTFENGLSSGVEVSGAGGAIHLKANAGLFLENVSFKNNRAASYGGAIYAAPGAVTVRGGRFEQNAAGRFGGAISVFGTADIQDAIFEANRADLGGGALAVDGAFTIEHNQFRRNTAGNEAEAGNGGAIRVAFNSTDVKLKRNTFVENEAGNGGGLYFYFDDPDNASSDGYFFIENNLWVKNRASQTGAQLYWHLRRHPANPEAFEMYHNTFVGDPASTVGLYLYLDSEVPVPGQATNNIVVAHPVGLQNGGPVQLISRYNVFQNNGTDLLGRFNDFNNLRLDPAAPLFVDAANLDFHLQTGTEAIDSGVPDLAAVDIEGTVRPQGDGFDRGAYEYVVGGGSGSNVVYLPLVVR